ncbi:isocitrate dehydrogenase, partial [Salmonella enterica]|nr:isocitrate dehydrogenase [Salmonella enterica subsp. enterica serovar Weltevreden]EAR5246160.1 isocitrate dehydrogenase [Salmonella enterica]EBV2463713.1 isocitrate dehydrogenase [Salmonella enterica subsp. enterica serovar Give]EBX9608754.1 isocitrate dehydrogenase [Salmonella enterica subsp. enterica serovar Bareilly]EBZ9517153.1 isocitrate dehydrogenase [Salmonella enterica subsp. enterica serovar Eastbourne]ECA4029657.1 isocitrate dehydrogenase [Salmonella enterica subsp. enterica serov
MIVGRMIISTLSNGWYVFGNVMLR